MAHGPDLMMDFSDRQERNWPGNPDDTTAATHFEPVAAGWGLEDSRLVSKNASNR